MTTHLRARRPSGRLCATAAAIGIALAPGAAGAPGTGAAGEGDRILVYAGAGFRLPVEEAARAFAAREGVEVEATFAGSGCLLAQAELAGRGDVFLPGEDHYLRQAQERDLAGEAHPVAYLRPVIAVPAGNPLGVSGASDLARPGIRVGLGDPQSVAVGMAAERWLSACLSPEELAAVHANVRTRAINVNELGTQLALGGLDAVVVWDATVPLFVDLTAIVDPSSAEFRTVVTGSVLTLSRSPDAAARFLSFLEGEDGARIFRRFGYEPYGPRPEARP